MGYNALEIVTYSMICGAILLGFWAGMDCISWQVQA